MDSTDQISDRLLVEIMQLEFEIDRLKALNGNREDFIVRQYRKFIQKKQDRLNRINCYYRDQFHLKAGD